MRVVRRGAGDCSISLSAGRDGDCTSGVVVCDGEDKMGSGLLSVGGMIKDWRRGE